MVPHATIHRLDDARERYNAGSAPARRFTMLTDEEFSRVIEHGPLALAVYVYLAKTAGAGNACWPSYKTISEGIKLSRRHVVRIVSALRHAELVTVEARTDDAGDATSNLFRLPLRPSHGVVTDIHHRWCTTVTSAPESPKVNTESNRTLKQARQSQKNDVLTVRQTELFNRWYQYFPRKIARGDAEKAWRKIDPTEEQVEQMIAALAWQIPANDWTPANRTYIPYPATYLNRGQWTDEPVAPVVETARVPDKVAFRQAQIQRAIDIAEGRA